VKQVGSELGVRYVLEGSVRRGWPTSADHRSADRRGNRHASLGPTGFDGSLEDIFELQGQGSRRAVAGVMEPALQAAETAPCGPAPDRRSYCLRSLSARLFGDVLSKADLRGARTCLRQAIQARPALQAPPSACAALCCYQLVFRRLEQRRGSGTRAEVPISPGEALEAAGDDPRHHSACGTRARLFRRGYRRDDGPGRPGPGGSTRTMRGAGTSAAYSGSGQASPTQRSSASKHRCASVLRAPHRDVSCCHRHRAFSLSRRFDQALPKLLLAIQEDPSSPQPYRVLAALLCAYGSARRGARDCSAVCAAIHASVENGRLAVPEPRAPRTAPFWAAPGGGRGGMSQTRRLAAILAADVAGYSRLMGGGRGRHARNASKALRRELLDPKNRRSTGGRIVKTTGDGLAGGICEWSSMQLRLRGGRGCRQAVARAQQPVSGADSRIELRIGINLGDVIVEGDGLYGDGVNIAARHRSAPPTPAAVFVSNTVHDHVRDRLPFVFEDLGEQQVKKHCPTGARLSGSRRPPRSRPSAPAPPPLPPPRQGRRSRCCPSPI